MTVNKNNIHAKFKSYYVVWKLDEIGKENPQLRAFKSYYVVWKPFMEKRRTVVRLSLNRTM